ncbi:MAG: hypothetical protein NTV51_26555 [Verrucomicrobia bacterium]|nr:hypothetical protein [Verrucomicrobiota bacterium]
MSRHTAHPLSPGTPLRPLARAPLRPAPRRTSPHAAPVAAFLLGALIALLFAASGHSAEPVSTGLIGAPRF